MDSKKIDYTLFKRLLKYAKPYKKIFFVAALCVLLLSFLSPLRPYLIGRMVDDFIVDTQNQEMLLRWSVGIIGLLFLEGLLQFVSSYFSNLLAQSVIRDIRKKLFAKAILVIYLLGFKKWLYEDNSNNSAFATIDKGIKRIKKSTNFFEDLIKK